MGRLQEEMASLSECAKLPRARAVSGWSVDADGDVPLSLNGAKSFCVLGAKAGTR